MHSIYLYDIELKKSASRNGDAARTAECSNMIIKNIEYRFPVMQIVKYALSKPPKHVKIA